MPTSQYQERILIVENDPITRDLIARQSLQPLGYRVKTMGLASEAILQISQFSPDVLVTNLNLPDLSGNDLLVALSSHGIEIPTILIAERGMESRILRAFRLGATDYLLNPIREAEVVASVERALKTVRARIEREQLAARLKKTNQELEQRVRELTTILAIGKAVTSITNQQSLFKRVIEGAIFVSEADRGWLLIHNEKHNALILRAHHNLPNPLIEKLNRSWDDGISPLVALSGEPLSIYGKSVKRFKISQLGQALMVVPIKAQKQVVGLLVVMRKKSIPFSKRNQFLLEAVADYASISLINARLFKALEKRARQL
ncbi:MAG: response regulator [Anaerolineales bacterium]